MPTPEDMLRAVGDDIWQYASLSGRLGDGLEIAARLGGLSARDFTRLAGIHFILAGEVVAFLDDVPSLVARQSTTTEPRVESRPDRLSGAILWGQTLSVRQSGQPFAFVTRTIDRVYDTPENRLVWSNLRAIAETGGLVLELADRSDNPASVRRIVATRLRRAERWLRDPRIRRVVGVAISNRDLARIGTGRTASRLDSALAVHRLARGLNDAMDAAELQRRIRTMSLVPSENWRLLQLFTLFRILRELRRRGWVFQPRVFAGAVVFDGAHSKHPPVRLFHEATPAIFGNSVYSEVLRASGLAESALRPDIVVEIVSPEPQLLVVEVKWTDDPRSAKALRRAIFDLLAYASAYEAAVSTAPTIFLGVGRFTGRVKAGTLDARMRSAGAARLVVMTDQEVSDGVGGAVDLLLDSSWPVSASSS